MQPARTLRNIAALVTLLLCFDPADIRGQSSAGMKTPPACVECPSPASGPTADRKRTVKVLLRMLVTTEGRCEHVTVVRGVSPTLDAKAVSTVEAWRLRPAVGLDGKPMAMYMLLEIVFPVPERQLTDAELGELVERLGTAVRKKVNKRPIGILVIPFPLRDQIAAILSRSPEFKVANHGEFNKLLEREELEPEHFQSSYVISWATETLGADVAVLGEMSADQKEVKLRLMAITAARREKVADVRAKLEMTPEVAKAVQSWQTPTPSTGASEPATRQTSLEEGEGYKPGRDGVSVPKCKRCPNSTFPQAAIDARFQGTVILKGRLGVDGRFGELKVVKKQPIGLTQKAIEIVRLWELQPATKDGKAVPVWMLVEVVFRQH